jgi:hypothetical protein
MAGGMLNARPGVGASASTYPHSHPFPQQQQQQPQQQYQHQQQHSNHANAANQTNPGLKKGKDINALSNALQHNPQLQQQLIDSLSVQTPTNSGTQPSSPVTRVDDFLNLQPVPSPIPSNIPSALQNAARSFGLSENPFINRYGIYCTFKFSIPLMNFIKRANSNF